MVGEKSINMLLIILYYETRFAITRSAAGPPANSVFSTPQPVKRIAECTEVRKIAYSRLTKPVCLDLRPVQLQLLKCSGPIVTAANAVLALSSQF